MDLWDFFTQKRRKMGFIRVYMIRNGSQKYLEIAQDTTGSITGTVTDPKGAVIAGATVTLTNAATDNKRTTTTNGDGAFMFPTLEPGIYTVTVNAMGFKKAVVPQIQIDVGKSSSIDVDMEAGHVKETVTVGAGESLQTQTATSAAFSTVAGTLYVRAEQICHCEIQVKDTKVVWSQPTPNDFEKLCNLFFLVRLGLTDIQCAF